MPDPAVATLAAWVGHPAVRVVIKAARPHAGIHRLGPLLARPTTAAATVAPLFGAGYLLPDDRQAPNPWRSEAWQQATPKVIGEIAQEAAILVAVADTTAALIAAAGAPIDPAWVGDRITVALLLADRWWSRLDLPAPLLARLLVPAAPYLVSADGRRVDFRAGVRGEAERAALAFRRRVEAQAREAAGRPEPPWLPYAGGDRRRRGQVEAEAQARRAALAAVLARYPDIEAHELAVAGGRLTPPACLFRAELARLDGPRWDLADFARRRRLLRDDLAFLRRSEFDGRTLPASGRRNPAAGSDHAADDHTGFGWTPVRASDRDLLGAGD